VEIQTLEKVIDDAGPSVITVDVIEDIACGLHRQCGDFRALAAWGECCYARSDEKAYGFELAQFIYHRINLVGIWSFGIENGFCVVEDYEGLLGGKEGSQRCQVLGVFNPCADDFGESGEEMGAGSRKLIAAYKSTVVAKSFFDPIVVEDREGNGRLPDPPSANQSDGFEVFSESDDFLNQLATSETIPRRRRRKFTGRNAMEM
jgi:hypothetical protein